MIAASARGMPFSWVEDARKNEKGCFDLLTSLCLEETVQHTKHAWLSAEYVSGVSFFSKSERSKRLLRDWNIPNGYCTAPYGEKIPALRHGFFVVCDSWENIAKDHLTGVLTTTSSGPWYAVEEVDSSDHDRRPLYSIVREIESWIHLFLAAKNMPYVTALHLGDDAGQVMRPSRARRTVSVPFALP
jgi:hypothetical protein